MTVPPVPDLLTAAGLSWRRIEPLDEMFVVDSWRASALKPFVIGDDTPETKKLPTALRKKYYPAWTHSLFPWMRDTVQEAHRERNIKLLRVIFTGSMPKLINQYLAPRHILTVFNPDLPDQIVGWGCAGYCYVKFDYRNAGMGTELRRAFAHAEYAPHASL